MGVSPLHKGAYKMQYSYHLRSKLIKHNNHIFTIFFFKKTQNNQIKTKIAKKKSTEFLTQRHTALTLIPLLGLGFFLLWGSPVIYSVTICYSLRMVVSSPISFLAFSLPRNQQNTKIAIWKISQALTNKTQIKLWENLYFVLISCA